MPPRRDDRKVPSAVRFARVVWRERPYLGGPLAHLQLYHGRCLQGMVSTCRLKVLYFETVSIIHNNLESIKKAKTERQEHNDK